MAIAVDATSSTSASGSPITLSHTCTGSNLLLIVGTRSDDESTNPITGVTYNGVAMTQLPTHSPKAYDSGSGRLTLWYLFAPATGANTISIATSPATSGMQVYAASYTGVAQSGFPDASTSNFNSSAASGSNTTTITTVAANAWALVMHANDNGAGSTAGSGATIRVKTGAGGLYDSNGALAAGSHSMTVNLTVANPNGQIMVSFAPFVAAAVNSNFFAFM